MKKKKQSFCVMPSPDYMLRVERKFARMLRVMNKGGIRYVVNYRFYYKLFG